MKLLFTGDLFYSFPEVRSDIRELGAFFKEREYLVIPNLEGGFGSPEGKGIWKRGAVLKQSPVIMEVLKTLGTAGVTLANNHMMDYGGQGLYTTLKELDRNKILHTGAGRDLISALKPMEFTFGGKTTAVFNFGWKHEETVYAGKNRPGCAPREEEIVIKTIEDYVKDNPKNAVIAVLHWGFEKNLYPMPVDIELGRRLCRIDGVKAVIGHHPHCPQPFEEYSGKKIYYSLGNFYFGKSRPNYSKLRYPHDPVNMSDYGLGVIYDIETSETDAITFIYDKEQDKTIIADSAAVPWKMPDITDKDKYLDLVKTERLSKAPVLLSNGMGDKIKVFLFNGKRNFRRCWPF